MSELFLEMKFDPQTIKHLGLRMYSTLPPALAELVSNAYDADAENVVITLVEKKGKPIEIQVADDGIGLSFNDIKNKFLIIGRNRRADEGDMPSQKFGRLPTGKKGLGKLAMFGLAQTITIITVQNGYLNEFVLDWNDLMSADGVYRPMVTKINIKTDKFNGTVIKLAGLKRKSKFDFEGLANSLSKIFLFDNTFTLQIESSSGNRITLDNFRKYNAINVQFSWKVNSTLFIPKTSKYYGKLNGELFTAEKPIPPASGLRGITLFSRGKLVNEPEFFSSSTSSHFYQYLTGWMSADFIDLLEEDVIATNRRAVDWEYFEMANLRKFLSGIVSQVNTDWRRKRKELKERDLMDKTGIDTSQWIKTMPDDIRENTQIIIEALGGEDALEKFTPIVKALHEIVPEYPLLHWRHLHPKIQEVSKQYYESKNYYTAFIEATKSYTNAVKKKSGSKIPKDHSLMGAVFNTDGDLDVVCNYKRPDGSDFTEDTKRNIQNGQQQLSQGILAGGRNPLSHEEINDLKASRLFSEKDCLDLLSLLSHLYNRLDNSSKRSP